MLRKTLWGAMLLAAGCSDATRGSGGGGSRCGDGGCAGECRANADCRPGDVCVEGVCAPDNQPLPQYPDCGPHEVARGSACVDPSQDCLRNSDCPAGYRCSRQSRRCFPADDVERPCTGEQDCFAGEDCVDRVCRTTEWDAAPADAASPDSAPRDAAPVDAARPDAAIPDATPRDAALIDALIDATIADATIADATIADATIADGTPRDAAAIDAVMADSAIPDAMPRDATPIDAATPDAALPDAALPDAALPDAALPDAAMADAAPPIDAAMAEAAPPIDAAIPDAAVPDAAPPPPVTPPRGVYRYDRVPVGGLRDLVAVEIHPDGTYAIALEYADGVHAHDWATRETTRFDLAPHGGAAIYWEDLAFDPSGDFALLVGYRLDDGAEDAVIYRFDDAAWRAGGGDPVIEPLVDLPGVRFTAIEYPPEGGPPVVLARTRVGGGYIATLRELDPVTGAFDGLVTAHPSGAGCDDLAFAHNEFDEPGIFVACGENGADTLYYTEIAGVGEWRVDPGNNNLGNTGRVAAHPSGAYALVVSWSGRALYRFELGRLNGYNDAPRFRTQGIWGIKFQPDGRRALIVGRTSGNPATGTVLEYRHDEYGCVGIGECGLTDVSIPGFAEPPYNGTSNTYLKDAAFRPGCDGGLVVGGETDWQGSTGYLVRFQIENGRACP